MRILFILLILIVSSCAQKNSITNSTDTTNLNLNKNLTFNDYVNKLLTINKSKLFPDINDIPE
jgi:hypothetical protein|tara:strand:- start:1989 stop:2177 length:189 start_codon:yes stop_codon:yes gene_type:complete